MTASSFCVAFDVTPVISGRTGIARYVTQLGGALEQRGVTLHRFAIGRRTFTAPPATRHVGVPARILEASWRAFGRPSVERLIGVADVVHATGMLIPRSHNPLVVTVHDVAALRYPELHPARHVRQQQAQLQALTHAAAVVAVSAATADDLAHLGIASKRLVVAPLGVTPLPEPASETERPSPGYLLTVGETSPRKGYDVVLRALSRLDHDLRLVMAGPPATEDQRLRSLAGALGLTHRVSHLGSVTDAMLAGLYRGALALCFPSVAEGFGLPVLEAMSAGVPVLASDIPAIRELAGDAVIHVARNDEQAWAEAIKAVASDAHLRRQLADRGRRRAAEFTWDRTAAATVVAYRLALETTS